MNIKDFIFKLKEEIKNQESSTKQYEQLQVIGELYERYNGPEVLISSHDLIEKIKNQGEEYKVLSGWGGLDALLGGFRLGQLIVLSAPTKNGKTTFMIDLTSRIEKEQPVWFPFEEGGEELVQKYLERDELPPLFYLPKESKPNNLEWLEQRIIEAKVKYNSKFFIIDHLDFIVPFAGDRHDLMVAEVTRKTKQMAKFYNVVIVLIAHVKKTKMTDAPDLEDIRGSASIAQEADTVIMLWRKTERQEGRTVISDEVHLAVLANRRTGKTGNITLSYKDGHFREIDTKTPEQIDQEFNSYGKSYESEY
jgi:replicative DNA helicase